jgi:hypothetical protein
MDLRKLIREVLSETFGGKIIAYHGTDNAFDVFDDSNPIFFVDNPEIAKTYGDRVIKAELNIEAPVVFDFDGKSTYFFNDKWFVPSELAKYIKGISEDIKNHYQLDDDLVDELAYHEYEGLSGDLDGIIMKNIKDANDGVFSNHDSATNFVVFDKSQIKL